MKEKIYISILEIDNGWTVTIDGLTRVVEGKVVEFVHFEPTLEKALHWIRTKVPAEIREQQPKD